MGKKSFFASLAAWRDTIFCHFSSEHKMLGINSQTSECKNLKLNHLITLSARTSTLGGIVKPICLAVFRSHHQLELRRLFHRQVGGLSTLEDLST